jgi:hypothetical protein
MDRFCFADQFPVQPCQPREVFLLGQNIRLEGLQPRCQCRSSIPDLLRTDQSEGRILAKPLGIIHILVSSQATVHRLPQQVRKGEPRIVCPRIGQVLVDEFSESQSFV